MATFSIPIEVGTPHQTVNVDLDGVTYTLALDWSTREECWYIGISDLAGVVLVSGVKVVVNWPLLHVMGLFPGVPPGELMAVDTAGTGADPDLTTFGDTIALLYLDAAGEAAIANG